MNKLIWISVVCVLYLVIHPLLLVHINWFNYYGMLLQGLSLSYIAAFLFYLVHNYYPYISTKKRYETVIDRELSDLWEICNGLTYSIRHHSSSINTEADNISKQLQNLPVNLKKDVEENELNGYPVPPDKNFDEKNKPIIIRELGFDKWSDAAQYVSSKIGSTLNKVLKMKDVVEEETILKLFDLENAINDFRTVATIYERENKDTFKNGYLEQKFVKFYDGTNELKKYKEDPSTYEY
ncbi:MULTISPECIES: hypothetical protein [Oceanobacillus]|uniref:Uncharacterized protein n=1 Tax=Oceanobacillus kimchii TaxID=746691 RepID=A0ABQ5TQW8_9BACI|nr:hypothetical protein [Oceanobacillus kimchii]GLO68306.1 hypothetical protein MACH08_40900 [Oceanobacillus kimchii]